MYVYVYLFSHLVVGNGEKIQGDGSIGHFGTGVKAAICTLVRNKLPVQNRVITNSHIHNIPNT